MPFISKIPQDHHVLTFKPLKAQIGYCVTTYSCLLVFVVFMFCHNLERKLFFLSVIYILIGFHLLYKKVNKS